TRLVNHARLGRALLELRDPPIRALFVSANNPAVTCPDSRTVRRALERADLYTVVHDPFLSDTARYADLGLPAATYLETEDLYRAYGSYYVQFGPRALAPQGEAWSNVRLAQELARRLGVTDPVFSMDTAELVRVAFADATGPAAELDPDAVRAAGPLKIDPYPAGQRFATPSGKLEFYSEALAARGLPPMPDWREDADPAARPGRWPLRLLTAPGYFQSHTAFSGNPALRRREGAPIAILHPRDAERAGLRAGEPVELFNDHGTLRVVLRVSDEVAPGVVLVPGQRPAHESAGGTVNVLCGDELTDLGEGATYQSTLLAVRRAS